MASNPIHLELPLDEKAIELLSCGDVVTVTGTIFTGRDLVHKRIIDYYDQNLEFPFPLEEVNGSLIYHCGPVVKGLTQDLVNITPEILKNTKFISAGPTTSQRMAPYIQQVLRVTNLRGIIGKGGITPLDCQKPPCVYFTFPGGAGVVAANRIEEILGVYWLDLGIPEAIWKIRVKNFGPLLVTQDSRNRNWYRQVESASRNK